MNGYLLSVIGIVLLSSLLNSILPDGKTRGLIQGITRLACVLAIVSPIFTYLQSGAFSVFEGKKTSAFFSESVIQSEEAFIEYYSELRVSETESALQAEILEKYGVKTILSLSYERKNGKIKILQIQVKMGTDTGKKGLICQYLKTNYCEEVLIDEIEGLF